MLKEYIAVNYENGKIEAQADSSKELFERMESPEMRTIKCILYSSIGRHKDI